METVELGVVLMFPATVVPEPGIASRTGDLPAHGAGSIIVIIATDAPLIPGQCARLAQRAGLGIARTGGVGEHFSGDLVLAFATGNAGLPTLDYGAAAPTAVSLRMLVDAHITALFDAVVEATEEAIVGALFAGETMSGRWGTAHALPADETVALLTRLGRSH